MKINAIKFFRTVSNNDKPKPLPSVRTRFEFVRKDKKLGKFI